MKVEYAVTRNRDGRVMYRGTHTECAIRLYWLSGRHNFRIERYLENYDKRYRTIMDQEMLKANAAQFGFELSPK